MRLEQAYSRANMADRVAAFGGCIALNRTVDKATAELVTQLEQAFPGLPNARWVALRLLDGDQRLIEAVQRGELGDLTRDDPGETTGNLYLQLEATQHA